MACEFLEYYARFSRAEVTGVTCQFVRYRYIIWHKRLHRSWSRDGWQKPKMINSSAVLDVAVPVEANVLQLARSPARIMFSLLIRIDVSYRPAPPA